MKLRELRKLEAIGARDAFEEESMAKEKAAEETYNYDTFRSIEKFIAEAHLVW